ncbi:peptidylprolyl isomerase [Elysia marginata]|uniref:Peptidylprolyl isomerase n=1 Tax=Elysia marginata TaxID=1093978 RepID=A0AAV4G668_9GAST|nr:peptidylprolyl isomerase [Elysia marginata]
MVSCDLFVRDDGSGDVVVRVKDKYLTKKDIQDLILKKKNLVTDSTKYVKKYIANWASRQLLLDKALLNLSKEDIKKINKLAEEYRDNILISSYMGQLSSKSLDTVIGENELKEIYEQKKNDYKLNHPLVKLRYIHVLKSSQNFDEIIKMFKRYNEQDIKALDKLSLQFIPFYLNDSTWVKVDQIYSKIEKFTPDMLRIYLSISQQIESEDNIAFSEGDSFPSLSNPKHLDIKVDGVVSVVGDYIIMESDIDKAYLELKSQGLKAEEFSHCQLMSKLMQDKLYAHNAIQDSILISDMEVKTYVDRQIEFFLSQMGNDMNKLVKFYNKENEKSFRKELFEINKINLLSQKMKAKIIEKIEVTPEEVREFFEKIPKDERPYFGTEIEVSQIVKKPKISKWEEDRIVEKLLKMKEDVEEKGASFASKALLYSQDPGSRSRGGYYALTKKSPMLREFKDIAFGLEENEISAPFETEYGWHIIYLEKIRGEELDVRHILLIPEPTQDAILEAREEINKIRDMILSGKISFAEGARKFSDEKQTKFDGGKLINPINFDNRFELTKMDPALYDQVKSLSDNDISLPLLEKDKSGKLQYKIIQVTNRFDEHEASFTRDYLKIQDLALKEKHLKTLKKWIKEKSQSTFINISRDYKNCDFRRNWASE